MPKAEGTEMVSKNIFLIFRLFSRESSCNSQKMDIFIELRSFQTYMVKSDKISAFLSLDNIPGAEPINQTLKEAQDTL